MTQAHEAPRDLDLENLYSGDRFTASRASFYGKALGSTFLSRDIGSHVHLPLIMKNILYIATSDIHLKTFHIPYLDALVRNGNNVDLAFDDRGGITFGMARQEYRI